MRRGQYFCLEDNTFTLDAQKARIFVNIKQWEEQNVAVKSNQSQKLQTAIPIKAVVFYDVNSGLIDIIK